MKPIPELSDEEIERLLQQGRRLESAPEFVIQRALAVFKSRPQAEPEPGLLRRLLATLTFDSAGASPLAYGMRSGGGEVRQLLYSVEGRDIDLRLSRDAGLQSGHWRLSGQILGPDMQGRIVLRAGERQWETPLSEVGEFHFDPVAGDPLQLSLHLAGTVIELPPIALEAA